MSVAAPPTPPDCSPTLCKLPRSNSSESLALESSTSTIDYPPISTTLVTKTSLFTYSSHSSLTSIDSKRARNHALFDRPENRTDSFRCDSPDSIGQGVRLYDLETTVISPIHKHRLPTPPSPRTPERGYSEAEDTHGSNVYDSTRRSLRRIRGSISEKRTGYAGSEVFLDDESIVADVGLLQTGRRESLTLHHPRPLKSSPKSAYLEEERRKSLCGGVPIQLPIDPFSERQSRNTPELVKESVQRKLFDTGEQSGTLAKAKISSGEHSEVKPEQRPVTQANNILIGIDHTNSLSEEDISDGGVGIKARVHVKSRRKLTPWPTPRALSFATSATDSQDSRNDKEEPGLSQLHDMEPRLELSGSSGTSSLADSIDLSNNSKRSYSKKDEEQLRRTQSLTKTRVDEQNPSMSGNITTSTGKKPVILIYQPPAQPSTPSKPPLPALTLIPATPQALPSSAEKEKQLGYSSAVPLLSRKATGVPTTSRPPSIPEDDTVQASDTSPVRPSIASIPKKVRESKLHPWWRPQRPKYGSDGEEHEEINAHEHSGLQRASTVPLPSPRFKGGRQMSIKGTKLVIEFVGWRGLLGRKKKE